MSTEPSSSSGPKRKRGPAPRPRGDPTEQVPDPDFGRRRIQYSERERLPICSTRILREHTLLRFQIGTPEFKKFDALVDTDLLEHRAIDWDWLDTVGQRDRIKALLGPRFRAALDCHWP